MVEEEPEPPRQFVLLEGPHRVRIRDRAHVVEVDMSVDQSRHDPRSGRIDLLSASERFGRHGGDLRAVDGDVVQTGERLAAVEDMCAADDEVVGRRTARLCARDRFRLLVHRSHSWRGSFRGNCN
ncbi:hypothetical protein ACGFZU_43005 [Streptomyces tendae]|uniref:hypothetical protein n=1 Tax=Streptomyces tendae TaxID=1932 RepID=UPI0037192FE6